MYKTWDNVSQSLRLAWKYKILWVFALLIAGTSSSNFNNSFGDSDEWKDETKIEQKTQQNINTENNYLTNLNVLGASVSKIEQLSLKDLSPNFGFVTSSAIVFFFTSIALGLTIRSWALGSLITGTHRALEGGSFNLSELSNQGRHAFRRLVKLDLLMFIFIFVILLVPTIILLAIFSVMPDPNYYLFLFFVPLILIALIGAVYYAFTYLFAVRYIILKDKGIKEALKLGLKAFRFYHKQAVNLYFANCLVQIGIMIASATVIGVFIAPLFSEKVRELLFTTFIAPVIILSLPLLILVITFFTAVGGYISTFTNITWTRLFDHIEGSSQNATQ